MYFSEPKVKFLNENLKISGLPSWPKKELEKKVGDLLDIEDVYKMAETADLRRTLTVFVL